MVIGCKGYDCACRRCGRHVQDHERRELHPDHEHALRILSHHVMTLLELRRARRELKEARGQVTAEAALRESHEQLTQLTEYNQVFWITDPSKNRMLYVSPAYERIWGRSRERLYADPMAWLNSVHPEDRDRVRASMPRQTTCRWMVRSTRACLDEVSPPHK